MISVDNVFSLHYKLLASHLDYSGSVRHSAITVTDVLKIYKTSLRRDRIITGGTPTWQIINPLKRETVKLRQLVYVTK